VDAALLVSPQVVAQLVRGADRSSDPERSCLDDLGPEALTVGAGGGDRLGVVAVLGPAGLILGPDVGAAGFVPTEQVVVGQGVAEEVAALEASSQRLVLIAVTHERADAGDVGVD